MQKTKTKIKHNTENNVIGHILYMHLIIELKTIKSVNSLKLSNMTYGINLKKQQLWFILFVVTVNKLVCLTFLAAQLIYQQTTTNMTLFSTVKQ